jgi:hypothetical protein
MLAKSLSLPRIQRLSHCLMQRIPKTLRVACKSNLSIMLTSYLPPRRHRSVLLNQHLVFRCKEQPPCSLITFKQLTEETIVTKQNCIHEEIRSRLKSENVQYHQFGICSPFRLLKMKATITFSCCFSYRHENWTLAVRDEQTLRCVKTNSRENLLGPKRKDVTE